MTTKERRLKDSARSASGTLPIACSLSGPDLAERRRELIRNVFGNALAVRDLEDGYEFVFQGNTGRAASLVELIEAELTCCPFFTLELHLEPGGGQISLRVRGPAGSGDFVAVELGGAEGAWAVRNAVPDG